MVDIRGKWIEEVVRNISEAFASMRRPGADRVVLQEDAAPDLERDQVKEMYAYRNWKDVDVRLMLDTRESAYFLSGDGFRYFLPGFMIGVLRHYDEVDTMPETLIRMLVPDSDDPDALRADFDRMDGYTRAQRDAVRAFLWLYRDEFAESVEIDDVRNALRFWESVE